MRGGDRSGHNSYKECVCERKEKGRAQWACVAKGHLNTGIDYEAGRGFRGKSEKGQAVGAQKK